MPNYQHDFDISTADANTGSTFRAAINLALKALANLSAGAAAPATTYPFQLWADTTNMLLKLRDSQNQIWLIIGVLDTANLGFGTLLASNLVQGIAGTETALFISPAILSNLLQNNPHRSAAIAGQDVYTMNLTPAIGAYAAYQLFFGIVANANTSTTPTLNVNGRGAKTIKKFGGVALKVGDLQAGSIGIFIYDGANMLLINPASSTSAATADSATVATSLSMAGEQSVTSQNATNALAQMNVVAGDRIFISAHSYVNYGGNGLVALQIVKASGSAAISYEGQTSAIGFIQHLYQNGGTLWGIKIEGVILVTGSGTLVMESIILPPAGGNIIAISEHCTYSTPWKKQ